MRLYTLQAPEVWAILQKKGVYRCDTDKAACLQGDDTDDFRQAYDWLSEQLSRRLGPAPEGVKYPIWAWSIDDLSEDWQSEYGNYGQEMVKLELEVPDHLVIGSNFDAWNEVINGFIVASSELEKSWESTSDPWAEWGRYEQQLIESFAGDYRAAARSSWEGIFTLCEGDSVQYTFWEIRPEYVVGVEHFVCSRTA